MRFLSCRHLGDLRWGVLAGNDTVKLAPTEPWPDLQSWFDAGAPAFDTSAWANCALADVELCAPLPQPRRNLICLGLNYADHAAEVQGVDIASVEAPEAPMFFTKATTAVTGPDCEVVLDEQVTRRLDWEVELAVIIGRGGRHIPAAEAMHHVFGYTILNDLSARDLQKRHGQFFLGKSMDGSAPMGPWIVSADEIAEPHALDVGCSVNGVVKQASNTHNLIFRIPAILETLSRVMTLVPGDIIATGTPGGVGFVRDPREFLQAGDRVECSIAGIGTLANRIVGV